MPGGAPRAGGPVRVSRVWRGVDVGRLHGDPLSGPATGRHLGPVIGEMMTRARIAARAHTLPAEIDAKDRWVTAFMEKIERELAPTVQAMYASTLADPETPESVRVALSAATSPTHQVDSIVGFLAAILGIFSEMGAIAGIEIQDYLNHLNAKLTPNVLPPAEAALAVLRGNMGEDAAAGEAAKSGINRERFDTWVLNTGEPPAVQELLFAWRRGIIDTARLERGVRQSRVRNEWIDVVEALGHGPLTAGEAVLGAVQNHLDDATARQLFAENGFDPRWYDVAYQNAGRPPGLGELGELVNRGQLSEAELEQAIRESDVKDKYIAAVALLRFRRPPERTVVSMVRFGVLTSEQGVAKLLELGYLPDDAAALVAEAHHTALASTKEVAQGQVLAAYRDAYVDRATAVTMLRALNFDPAAIEFMLGLADYEQKRRRVDALLTKTRTQFLARRIDANTASGQLDAGQVPPTMRDAEIDLWKIELDGQVARLTLAQTQAMAKKALITREEFTSRVAGFGYSDLDVALIVEFTLGPA